MRKTTVPVILMIALWALFFTPAFAQNPSCTFEGTVVDQNGQAVEAVSVLFSTIDRNAVTDKDGFFRLDHLKAGKYTVTLTQVGYHPLREEINLKAPGVTRRKFILKVAIQELKAVEIVGSKTFNTYAHLPEIKGTDIYAGKKNELINVGGLDADLAENLPRQIFSKVPGVMVWEMDGTGNQVGISTRGLIPHRSWELHVQQNGNTTNSDLFGYPESHYNPPMEAVGSIKMVRGSGALQYGPQFGGLLDYELKEPDTLQKISLETQESVGSFGLFGSFNSIGGKIGKLTYYGYYDFRRADGWRQNSDYHFNAWHTSLKYAFTPEMSLSAELSHMEYVNHFAAGLTDSLFEADPQYSNRPRNYFNPTIYVPALHYSWQIGKNTLFTARTSGIFGERNSVQFITLPTVDDVVDPTINDYKPRQVDRDYYHSYAGEARLLQGYQLLKNESHLSLGVRYGNSRTLRKQKGKGTGGADFDLSLTDPYKTDLVFKTQNYAFFAENLFKLTRNFSITPGFRYEVIHSDMSGEIKNLPSLRLPFKLERNFPLFGCGMEYKLSSKINAYANFTQNFRPILHSDLVPPTDLDRIDPNLEDSQGNSSELGIRGMVKEVLQFDVNYFRLQYDKRIGTLVQNDASGTYFYHTNVGDMVNQGAEFYVEFHPFNLAESAPKYLGFSIFTSTSYNSAKYTRGTVTVNGDNKDIKGNEVENVPHWISRNGITYHYQRFSATLQGSYVGQNYSDALNVESTPTGVNGIVPAYFLTDISCTYYFLDRFNIRCSVNNLADKRYFTRRATGYPGPGILPSDGRSLLVSFGAKF